MEFLNHIRGLWKRISNENMDCSIKKWTQALKASMFLREN